MAVARETLIHDVFQTFYDLIKTNVTDPQSRPDPNTWIFTTYPTKRIENKSDYPIIIINSTDPESEQFTFAKMKKEISIPIEIHAEYPKHLDILADSIIYQIESHHADTIRPLKLFLPNDGRHFTTSTSGPIRRGALTTREKIITFRYMYHHAL